MKKSKLENLLSPSSSWRENHNPPPRKSPNSSSSAVSSGCLPGFFTLFLSTFNFSTNRRKRITIGSKKREQQQQRTVVYASPPPQDSSNGEDGVAPPLRSDGGEGDAARVSLVGALEKCDRDLEELRRTIDVIKTTYLLHKKLEVSPVTTARENVKFSGTVAEDVVVGTQSNKNSTKKTEHETQTDTKTLSTMNHHDYNKAYKVNNINLITKPDHYTMHNVITNIKSIETRGTTPFVVHKVRWSLLESVNQVCDDVASGQRRELAKIGLALHDHICRDLISETIQELFFFSDYKGNDQEWRKPEVDDDGCYGGGSGRRHIRRGSTNSLPLDVCRRRLVF